MIAAILGSFAILVGFVVACDKIVGPDPVSMQSTHGDGATDRDARPDTAADQTAVYS